MKGLAAALVAAAWIGLSASSAFAWGNPGHELIGHIAYSLLAPATRAKVDAMLATDKDKLTAPDFASRATWADAYRNADNKTLHYDQTHLWYFTDLELQGPDLDEACFHFPRNPFGRLASAGPVNDCLTNKEAQFEQELAAPQTPPAERLLALKYVMTFVGDLHMPFHVSDNHDDHGNCLQVRAAPDAEMKQLHHYWDDVVIDELVAADRVDHPEDTDLAWVGQRLRGEIKPADLARWRSGDARQWTLETFEVAQAIGYDLPPHPVCTPGMKWADYPPFVMPFGYQTYARNTARLELQQAGVRLAWVLDQTLGKSASVPPKR